MVGVGCRAETDWQKRTKRSDFVLTVRLSAAQGLALRLGLSNDIPNELNILAADGATTNVVGVALGKPGALQA
jgi:hypothetical protein